MPKSIKITSLRDNLAEALKQAKDDNFLIVTKNNQPISALVDIDYFEDLLTISNPRFLSSLEESKRQVKNGEIYTLEEVMKELN
ncbi:MAG: type II toxin-antitoxin system prevent-host-death family antitoxin [Patescibacteria group bacterium]